MTGNKKQTAGSLRWQVRTKEQSGSDFHLTSRCQAVAFGPYLYFSECGRPLPLSITFLRTGKKKSCAVKPHELACTFTSGCIPFLKHMKNGSVEHARLRRVKGAALSITVSRLLTLRLLFVHWHLLASGINWHILESSLRNKCPTRKAASVPVYCHCQFVSESKWTNEIPLLTLILQECYQVFILTKFLQMQGKYWQFFNTYLGGKLQVLTLFSLNISYYCGARLFSQRNELYLYTKCC